MQVTRYKPQAIVTFYTETGELVARATNDPKSRLDDDVISIQTTRDLGADAPTFSINLTRRKMWHKWIASNDLVIIMMHRPPEKLATVFVGLVDDCRKRVSIQDDSVQRMVTVTGRGVAKAFIQFDIGIVPEAEPVPSTVGWLVSNGIMLSGSTAKVILQSIWDVIAKKLVDYKWSNGRTLFDLATNSLTDKEGMVLLDDTGIINWQGSMWALMKEIAEEPFYELYWEIVGEKPTMIMRPTPFSKENWDKLPTTVIKDDEVVIDEVGRSDLETYTLFSVGAKTLFSPFDQYRTFGMLPLWYKPYADKYGIRRLHVESAYTAVAESVDASTSDIMRSLTIDLYNWNIKNNSMYNGVLVVKGSNRFKIGTRLLYISEEDNSTMEYYVKSVSHNFVNFGSWTTELGVIRGIEPEERFTEPYNSFEEYSGMGLVTYDPDAARELIRDGHTGALPISEEYEGKARDVISLARDIMENGINGVRVKYVFGGNDLAKGQLDCSSFTQYVYKTAAGVNLGRTTGTQVTKGTRVEKNELQPGDLVFFKNTYDSPHIYGVSHVGIYIGDGQFIHNSSGAGGVAIGKLSSSYWTKHWLMGRRVLQPESYSAAGKTFIATAYGANPINLGVPPGYPATGITATGTVPKEGRTVAVDPKVIPLGSRIKIISDYPGITGEYIAEDTGGAIKGNRIDIYFDDLPPNDPYKARKRMLDFGKRTVKVIILERG